MSSDAYYDARWSLEDQRDRPPNRERIERVAAAVARVLDERHGALILDVGCGNGWLLAELFARVPFAQLHGIEPSQQGVENTQRRVSGARVWRATLDDVATAGEYDLITCSEVIEHVSDQQAFARRLSLLLKPGGYLVLTTPNGRYRAEYFQRHGVQPQPIEQWCTQSSLESLFRRSFEVIDSRTFNLAEYFLVRPRVQQLLKAMRRRPFLRPVAERLQDFLAYRGRGLYLLLVLQKMPS